MGPWLNRPCAPCLPRPLHHVGNRRPKNVHQAKLNEYEFPVKKVANVQSQLSRLIEKNYYLNKSAREVRKRHTRREREGEREIGRDAYGQKS